MKNINKFIPVEKKEIVKSVRAFLPLYACIPFSQTDQGSYKATVNAGDVVKEGQTIAVLDDEKLKGADVNSSVSGIIDSFIKVTLPDGRVSNAVKIKTGGSFKFLGKKAKENILEDISAESLLRALKDKGVVNTFNGTYSLSDQIKNCPVEKNRFLIVRMFDEDPAVLTDRFVASKFTEEVIKGACAVAKAMSAEGIVFVIPEKNFEKPDLNLISDFPCFLLEIDTTEYPCASVSDLVKKIKKNEISSSDKFRNVSKECIFIDSVTAYSAYEACILGIPVVERFVHVSGPCINSSAVLRIRIGSTIRNIVNQCGGFKSKSNLILVNGMIKGSRVASLNVPVTKSLKALIFSRTNELDDATSGVCVHCGRCRSICPEHLYPDLIYQNRNDKDYIKVTQFCTQCNLCNSSCPSRIPLSQTIAIMREKNAR